MDESKQLRGVSEKEKSRITPPDFLLVPWQLIIDPEIAGADYMVHGVVYWLSRLRDNLCTASNTNIARLVGTAPKTVQNSLTKLEQKGYVVRYYKDKNMSSRSGILSTFSFQKISRPQDISCVKYPVRKDIDIPYGGTRKRKGEKEGLFSGKTDRVVADATASKSMNLDEFVTWCRRSPHRHIILIAEYADQKKLAFATRGQWDSFIRRNLRAAKLLAPYDDRQIAAAMGKLEDKQSGDNAYITEWSLETLLKFLDHK